MESYKTVFRIVTAAALLLSVQAQSFPLPFLSPWFAACASWIGRSQPQTVVPGPPYRAVIDGEFLVFPNGAKRPIEKRLAWGRIVVRIPFNQIIRSQNSYIHQVLNYYFEQPSVVKHGFQGDLTPDGNIMIEDGHHRVRVYHQKFSKDGLVPFILRPEGDGSFATRSHYQVLLYTGKLRGAHGESLSAEAVNALYLGSIDQILLERASETVLQKIYLSESNLPAEFQTRRQRMRGIRPGVVMWDY